MATEKEELVVEPEITQRHCELTTGGRVAYPHAAEASETTQVLLNGEEENPEGLS